MPTSARDAIIDAVVTALQEIGSTGSYNSQIVPRVMRALHPAANIPRPPVIEVGTVQETYVAFGEGGRERTYHKTLTLAVTYWLEAMDMDAALSGAVHDLEFALRDHTLGGVCNELTIKDSTSFLSDLQQPLCGVLMTVEITYRVDENLPSVRV